MWFQVATNHEEKRICLYKKENDKFWGQYLGRKEPLSFVYNEDTIKENVWILRHQILFKYFQSFLAQTFSFPFP